MPKKQIQILIHSISSDAFDFITKKIKEKYPRHFYNKKKCKRDVILLLDAVSEDFVNENIEKTTQAGMAYIYSYNGLIFSYQKPQTLYSIQELKNYVLSVVDDDRYHDELASKFDVIIDIISDRTVREVKWWDYAARVAPFVALALIVLSELLDVSDITHWIVIAIIVGFFTTGVTWWWWSIYKIAGIVVRIRHSQHQFVEITHQLRSVKHEVAEIAHETDTSTRKRRKPSTSQPRQTTRD